MTKIYVSEKTLDKLAKSQEHPSYTKLFSCFDIEHTKLKQPNPKKQKSKPITRTPKQNQNQKTPKSQTTIYSEKPAPANITIANANTITNTDNNINQYTDIESALQIMHESLSKTRHSYTYSPQRAKELSQMLKDKKRKQQIAKLQKSQKPVKQLRPKIIKLKKAQRTSKHSSRPLVKTTDYNDLAGEYESRQVETGHGRAKSKEWNDEIARKFQKELKSYHKKRDWTDRFALK